ncbi:PREDICTED: actin cytoskeleton-regulatory complex protein PAN1-like [Papilio polytes]|uniref:actin cytoskeleton-regulatory complex protein PAN1-like n=1 Tax=Papilio polytes TaxID=76194 RepID=UPI00067683E7|nr:PREDICTED: actin cytoskeleton-regulatory complex protein PAN1-like [Papilio polytes]
MKKLTLTLSLLVISVLCNSKVSAGNLPGPMVYVVTPATRSAQNDEGRARPFYYRNWIRRMDSETSTTTAAPTTSTVKVDTPDLIFAEFESDGHMKKSIRKLLEKERVETKTSTTFQPIYVPDEEFQPVAQNTNYGLPLPTDKPDQKETEESKYFEMHNKFYNIAPTTYTQTTSPTTTTTKIPTTISTQATPSNIENIWHIIDSEKSTQHSGNWEEVPIGTNEEESKSETQPQTNTDDHVIEEDNKEDNEDDGVFTDFAVPGFSANPGNDAENESRGIRTESNFRFPYVNLKPFQIKTMKKPTNNLLSNSKKNNNLFTNLDNFYDLKNPIRGEAQDIVPQQKPIDRYNPAQPYLPQQSYGSNSKESNNVPAKATANLVPPPPPQAPKITDNDFPSPTNYESFPPYAPLSFNSAPQLPSPPPPAPKPVSSYSPPAPGPLPVSSYSPPAPGPLPVSSYSPPAPPGDSGDSDTFDSPPGPPMDHGDSDSIYSAPSSPEDSGDSDLLNGHGDDMDLGYRYKPPSGPPQSFAPTAPPMPAELPMPPMPMKPFEGYNYNKPFMPPDSDMPDHDIKPDFHGFYDDKPDDFHYHHHHHPTTTTTEMPRVNRYSYYYLGKKLYYLPLYFSVYFIVYVGALIVKAVLRHKIVYPNSWRPNDTTAGFFSKRSIDSWDLSNENLHEVTGKVTHAIATAAKIYMDGKDKNE